MPNRGNTKAELLEEIRVLQRRVEELEPGNVAQPTPATGPKLGGLLEAMADLVFVFDADRRFVFCNAVEDEERLLVPPGEFLGKRHDEILPAHVDALFVDAFDKTTDGETATFDYEVSMPGGPRWFAATISPLLDEGGPAGAIALVRDITDRHEAEAAIRDAEKRWRSLVENTTDSIILIDRDGTILYVNQTVPDLDKGAIVGTPIYDYSPDHCVAALRETYERAFRTGEPARFETDYIAQDGEMRVFEGCIGPIAEAGKVVALTVSCRDITDRVNAQKVLAELEERFRTLFEQVADPVFLVDVPTRMIKDCNAAAVEVLGYTREELMSLRADDIDVSETPGFVGDVVRQVMSTGKAEFESRLVLKSGEVRAFDVKLRRVVLKGEDCILSMVHDISEPRRLERSIVDLGERQRRELAFNLHDDLGQHLTGLHMVSDVLCRILEREHSGALERAREVRDLVDAAVQKTRDLVHGFSVLESGPEGLVLGLQQLIEGVDGRSTDLSVRLVSPDDIGVDSDEVATHLYRIAEEAVSNAVRHASATEIVVRLDGGDERVVLSISDDGNGEAREAGGGMGLRIMQFRARMVGGSLSIESVPGDGTRVTCRCPLPPAPGDRVT